MDTLTSKKCVPCEGGETPLKRSEFEVYLPQVKYWSVIKGDKYIERDFKFKNFKDALGFVNQVGKLAELEGHHPDIYLHNWRKVRLTLSTHAIKGLSQNDFIMAAKIDKFSETRKI